MLNPDQLADTRSILPHILYEIEMYLLPLDADNNQLNELPPSHALQCALLESQLLHARSLLEFFMRLDPSGAHSDDVPLKHFGFENALVKKDDVSLLKTRLHKTLAHITYDRLKPDYNQQDWSPDRTVAILEGCGKFLDHLESEPLPECPDEVKDRISTLTMLE